LETITSKTTTAEPERAEHDEGDDADDVGHALRHDDGRGARHGHTVRFEEDKRLEDLAHLSRGDGQHEAAEKGEEAVQVADAPNPESRKVKLPFEPTDQVVAERKAAGGGERPEVEPPELVAHVPEPPPDGETAVHDDGQEHRREQPAKKGAFLAGVHPRAFLARSASTIHATPAIAAAITTAQKTQFGASHRPRASPGFGRSTRSTDSCRASARVTTAGSV
jgi:hypothetical protein